MSATHDENKLPVEEDMGFQRASWIVERIGWAVFAVLLVCALSGLFARGPLSTAAAEHPRSGLQVTYERFQRQTLLTRFDLRLGEVAGGDVKLHLGPQFQATYEIQSIAPRPLRSTAGREGLDFFFEPSQGALLPVTIWAKPRQFGFRTIEAAAAAHGDPLTLSVFIYP